MSRYLILLVANDFRELSHDVQLEVYKDFYCLVYPMVQFIIKDHGQSEDIIQMAFMRVLEKCIQVDEWDKLDGWLKTLTRNVALNYFRKIKRDRHELDDANVLDGTEDSVTTHADAIEDEVEIKLMEEAVAEYISQLKSDYRQVFEMRWLQNLSYKEIAAALNMPERIVKQRLYRARESIKKKLKEEWNMK